MAQPEPLSKKYGPHCILTIDDDKDVRSSIKLFLDDLDYLVLEASDGQEGLKLFHLHRPDLILLDLRMPILSGLDFLQQVRKLNSDTSVIVISGTGRIDDVIEALRHGADDFLLKPINDLQVLKHSVEKVLEKASLRLENRQYREHLEEIISHRTLALERTYQQLTQSEQKYRSIYENLQDIYFETSLDGTLQEISPSVEKSSNYKRDELLGKSVWENYVIPEQREQFVATLLSAGRIEDHEILLTDANGLNIYFSINAMLHRDNSGQPAHISGIMRNISERKASEEKWRATYQTLEALFSAAPLAIMAIDIDSNITLWNKAAEETFGWKHDEIVGQPYPLAVPGKEKESEYNLSQALQGNDFKGLELSRRHKDGHLVDISASTAPLSDKAGNINGVIIIIEDISEKNRLRSEADRSSRLASLGELAAGVAHEINNPNGLILLNLPTLHDFVMDAIKLHQHSGTNQKLGGLSVTRATAAFPQLLGDIEDSARRIKQIVEDLKSFAAKDTIERGELFDLNESATTAARLTSNHLKKATTRFSEQYPDTLPLLSGSAQRIEQVIVNLLVNACEALTDREQKIEMTTGQNKKTQEIYLCISDEGCGMSPEQLKHVTDPFFTTRRESGGTGLGLSVSARIIKEHHGRLEFESIPGQGTIARICFPGPEKGN